MNLNPKSQISNPKQIPNLKSQLNNLPKGIQDLINLAGDVARENHMRAYLVGGFVRDLLLGVKNLDLDIVVEGDGIKFAQELKAHLKAKLTRHKRFGTATIYSGHLKIDIATARRESYPQPAHLPVVCPGTLKDDLLRRDFTINAMAISINSLDYGKLLDFFKGKHDLIGRWIRILHSLSFIDDPTRILRAIRFEKRYNFRIEPNTLQELKKAVKLRMLEQVQPHRIRDDLILVLKENSPLKEIRRIQKLAGFNFLSEGLKVTQRTYRLLESVERQISWFKTRCLERRPLDTWLMYFMGLLDSLAVVETGNICLRFAFRKGEAKRILSLKRFSQKHILSLKKEKIKPSKISAILEPLSYEAMLLLKAKYKNRQIQKHLEEFFKNYHGVCLHISGHDLQSLGIKPGPGYQRIFKKVLNAKLNGRINSKEEELAYVRKIINCP